MRMIFSRGCGREREGEEEREGEGGRKGERESNHTYSYIYCRYNHYVCVYI